MDSLSNKFNAENAIGILNLAMEKQIAALQSTDKGVFRTLAISGFSSLKIQRAASKLAKHFGIKNEIGVDGGLIQTVAKEAKARNIQGSERLQELSDWHKEFWNGAEVRQVLTVGNWNFAKDTRKIKELAQKRPSP